MKGSITGIAVCLVLLLTACSSVDTAADELALHYEGGPIQDQKFKNCVKPGSKVFDGPGDHHYTYPIGQRTFRFDGANNGADSGPISIVSNDSVEMVVEGVATFEFVSDCEKVREFHEKIGAKYRRSDGDNWWKSILDTYLKQPLDKAMDASAKGADWRSLYSSPDAKASWEQTVVELAPKFVEQQAGGAYFSNFRLNLQVPQPPANIKAATHERQVAIEQNAAQKEKNETIRTALDGIKAEIAAIGPEAWAQKYAVDSGKVNTVIIAPPNAGVNVNAR